MLLLILRVEGGVALGDRSVKDGDLLGRRHFLLNGLALTVLAGLNEGREAGAIVFVVVGVLVTELSRVVGAAIRRRTRDNLGLRLITSSLVRAASGLVLVVVRNGSGLLTDAAGRGGAVHGTIGAGADLAPAVDADRAVGSSAERKIVGVSGDIKGVHVRGKRIAGLNERSLVVVVRLALHDDVLAEILITVHAGGEEHVILRNAGDTVGAGSGTSGELDEAGGGRHPLVPGGLIEVRRSIRELDGGGRGNNSGESHFLLLR